MVEKKLVLVIEPLLLVVALAGPYAAAVAF